jgi:hypothetical protein
MRRIELLGLLPSSAVTNESRRDVLRELAAVSSGGTATSVETLGGPGGNALQEPAKNVTEQLSELARHVTDLNLSQQTLAEATQDNTQAVTRNTVAKGSGGSSVASTVGHIASSLFGGGLSLSPMISGLMSLFGSGNKQTVAPLVPFQMPAPVQHQAGLTGGPTGQIVPVDYGQGGQVRPPTASSAPQINIQVNALDSRSFLDHSEEIARAVRAAILNSNSLNDVISDL